MRIPHPRPSRWLAAFAFFCLTLSAAALAKDNPEYTQTGHNITVGPDQQTGDVTCIACSIYIRGHVMGDATAVAGSIYLEDHAQVQGDVTSVAGNLRLDSDVKVGGDATVVGGEVRRAMGAQVGGDVTNVGGRLWIPVFLLLPFVFVGLLVAFVVWLVQRAGKPHIPAAAA